MSALDRRVDPKVREVRRLEVINGALGHQARQGRLVLPAEELSFVPVVRTAAAEAPPVANSAPPAGIIEVALGDAVVRVPPAVDRRLLTKVLRAVQALV